MDKWVVHFTSKSLIAGLLEGAIVGPFDIETEAADFCALKCEMRPVDPERRNWEGEYRLSNARIIPCIPPSQVGR